MTAHQLFDESPTALEGESFMKRAKEKLFSWYMPLGLGGSSSNGYWVVGFCSEAQSTAGKFCEMGEGESEEDVLRGEDRALTGACFAPQK